MVFRRPFPRTNRGMGGGIILCAFTSIGKVALIRVGQDLWLDVLPYDPEEMLHYLARRIDK